MKKFLILLLLIFLFSCEKEESLHCYKCKTIAKDYNSEIITCEKTIDEMENFRMGLLLQAILFTDSLATVTCQPTNCIENETQK